MARSEEQVPPTALVAVAYIDQQEEEVVDVRVHNLRGAVCTVFVVGEDEPDLATISRSDTYDATRLGLPLSALLKACGTGSEVAGSSPLVNCAFTMSGRRSTAAMADDQEGRRWGEVKQLLESSLQSFEDNRLDQPGAPPLVFATWHNLQAPDANVLVFLCRVAEIRGKLYYIIGVGIVNNCRLSRYS